MIRSNSLILSRNSSRTGKAISASSFSGVRSSFSGGRRMVKCTRSTDGSAFSRPPPGALAGMRLAGDQQHAQPVAHAVDLDHRAIVDRGDLAGERRRRQFHHGGTGAGDRQFDPLLGADRHVLDARRLAIAAHRQVGRSDGVRHAEILDGNAQRDRLADDAVTRRLDDAQAAVGLLALRRDQHIERRAARAAYRGCHAPARP